ncbi:3-phosphoserine/phosphohydroxythreonine transaminase [Hyphomicrobium sp.]|uniref:3-phosphoserine/phosphohydroxythreonine transaminase n=1 Tax=Hyphomicrobium sp. TaxID=82 RepID=UPI002C8237F4|nr:3-phosphoserine/phosphohydroxythreonine transaminase [Hyphomicrobium sp.]HRN87945.1 3-phosphoserine/phosphohydroxythreonine transaminase [Hyphomicrobium sp.]HRQ26231.1 3-phosphoserine/phosphohydroxythreonine transaminase [Hyphomicrobium sp.]
MAVYSFASGPSALPREVVAELASDVGNYGGSELSALELPFSEGVFSDILAETECDLRALLGVPPNYRVLFLQGGASAQFALLPMNLLGRGRHCEYVLGGHWSRRAAAEASRAADVWVIASGDGRSLPDPKSWRRSSDAAYCHYTTNETADGLQFHTLPDPFDVPLVSDMTADLLTRGLSVERFGLIYASAQKNLGAAGLTLVIVREDLLGRARRDTPAPFDYTRQAEAASKINTPPTFSVLIAHRMLRWLQNNGGVVAAERRSKAKCEKLYEVIDRDDFYCCPASLPHRSRLNVCFRLSSPRLEEMFLDEAKANGFVHLNGHRDVGGIRASLYNGVSEQAVDALVAFMTNFKLRRG